jgi:HlyD family secretion protein
MDIIDTIHSERNVFHPGMSATVDIRTNRVDDVLSVPIQAVTTRDTTDKANKKKVKGKDDMEDEGSVKVTSEKDKEVTEEKKDIECVFVTDGNSVKLTAVTTGIQDNNYIQIKSGLKEGQEIVAAPYNLIARLLKDGDLIEKVDKDELYSVDKK